LVPAGGGFLPLRRPVAVVLTKALSAAVQDVVAGPPHGVRDFLG
jgi:hypothetical protein